jgi:transposase-like protein
MKPAPTPLYTSVCQDCGITFERPSGRQRPRCHACAKQRQSDNLDQMHAKSGPLYEATVRQQAKFWRSEAKRLGIRL